MKIAKVVLGGAAAFAVLGSAALAQQPHTGTITQLNRLNNTVAIRQTQNGTVGANTGGAAEEFKVGNGISLETLHAGDIVNYSVNESGGAKTITKLERKPPSSQ
jgi:Copper binding periplasmic protein CusF